MGNKPSASPFPSYDAAIGMYSVAEMKELKTKFDTLSNGQGTITTSTFGKKSTVFGPYAQRHVHPRIFNVFDTKRDGVIDFEEYICAVTVFRAGGIEEKLKCIFIMYEGIKSGGSMTKDNFRQFVVDASLCCQKNEVPESTLDTWLTDMKVLSQGMAEAAFLQYATNLNKIEVHEFIAFAKSNESLLQAFIQLIVALFDS